MFDSVDTANDCIRIATGVLSTIRINPDRMLAGLSPDMLATDLAEYLVRKGVVLTSSLATCRPSVSTEEAREELRKMVAVQTPRGVEKHTPLHARMSCILGK